MTLAHLLKMTHSLLGVRLSAQLQKYLLGQITDDHADCARLTRIKFVGTFT